MVWLVSIPHLTGPQSGVLSSKPLNNPFVGAYTAHDLNRKKTTTQKTNIHNTHGIPASHFYSRSPSAVPQATLSELRQKREGSKRCMFTVELKICA